MAINQTKSILLPERCTNDEFLKAPFVIYANFKCGLVPSTDHNYNGPNTEVIKILFVVMATN